MCPFSQALVRAVSPVQVMAPGLQQIADELEVALLAGLHQEGRGPKLQVRPGLDQEVGHLKEAATAGQGQGRLLGFLSLSIDVSSLGTR